MTLHVFNPENDLALACFEPHFIPPRSARMMAGDLAVLPVWWAERGDAVCVPSPDVARRFAAQSGAEACLRVRWVSPEDCAGFDRVSPWGWSPMLVRRLLRGGCAADVLPDEAALSRYREMSGRRNAVEMLAFLTGAESELGCEWKDFLCGRSSYCTDEHEIARLLGACPETLLKAPWSGSGKGLRLGHTGLVPPLSGWCRRLLREQGGVVVEPLYDKVYDFAMEFEADGRGHAAYRGLSVFFTTRQGAYAGNCVADEETKVRWLLQHVPADLYAALLNESMNYVSRVFAGGYCGPLGVDMMLCRVPGRRHLCVHPCVEVNLRRTMGQVSVDLARYMAPGAVGRFTIAYAKDGGSLPAVVRGLMEKSPLQWVGGRISEGFLPLTPVEEGTHYHASLQVGRQGL